MVENALLGLEKISQAVGCFPEYVQGGGGNTSAKLDENLMAVKASGFRLSQINRSEGYVVVDYKKIREFYDTVDLNQDIDFEKLGNETVRQTLTSLDGSPVTLRPSVEAGFHSLLHKYVIHTHPVYANLLCCSVEGQKRVSEIFTEAVWKSIWVPYIDPGFRLTVEMQRRIRECIKEKGMAPQVIFLENHGLVVTADDAEECIRLHEEVNTTIRKHFELKEEFPQISPARIGENEYESSNLFLTGFFKDSGIMEDFFERVVLYPDQLVYLQNSIGIKSSDQKINIDTTTGKIVYLAPEKEAITLEETLLGVIFIVDTLRLAGLTLKCMDQDGKSFIENWESEKYRKSLVAGK